MKQIKNILSICLLVLAVQVSNAQNEKPAYESYDWDKNPNYSVSDQEASIVAVKHRIIDEFYFKGRTDLVEYYLEHKVLWLNSDDRIEEYNKIYLPFSSRSQLKVSKARVINANGEIIELDKSKILSAEDEETGQQYKYFALEGIDKGSFIEYFYVIEQYPDYRGKRLTFQTAYPKYDVTFDLYAPENLEFAFKSYNGLPEVKPVEETEGKSHWQMQANSLDGLEQEDVSAYHASKGFLVFKLDKNLYNNTTNISGYGNITQNIYAFYNPELSKKTKSALKDFIAEATKGADSDEASRVRKLEYFIKTNIYVSEANSDELKDLDRVLSEKVANESGLLKLYLAALKEMDVKHELVLTSDRSRIKMDPDFEAENFLTDFLIYFPKTKSYIDPKLVESRFGFPSPTLTDNYGLFIKEIKLGDNVSALGKIKYIEPVGADKTFDTMVIDVSFDPDDPSIANIKLDREMNGYYAMYLQPFIHLAKKEDRDELTESFAKNIIEDIEVKDKQLINGEPELFGIKPFKVVVDFETEALTEKAGNKYLFKLGDVIGPQVQMYQEKKRVLPVEEDFQRSYYRTINVNIPEGYRIANPDDINIKNSYSEGDEEYFSFHSYYKMEGNTMVVTADEHYRKNIVPKDLYEEYRTVINSAADFNKITLVLEPVE